MSDVFDIKTTLERYRGYVERAKEELFAVFDSRRDAVFYERQLQVMQEDRFFHWVTSQALKELLQERRINSELMALGYEAESAGPTLPDDWETGTNIRFYWSVRNRYWRAKARAILKLVRAYSEPELARSYGRQGEMMFDAALPKAGFLPVGENTNEYAGRRWDRSGHNLDRIFERDGVGFGVEIKNRLRYIEPKELRIKLEMCKFLGLKPVFVTRMMPKLYIYEVAEKWGGFSLVFKHQLYPFHLGKFAKQLREELGLPIDCPHAIERGTIERFLNWHLRELRK